MEDDGARTEPGLLASVVRLRWLVALLVVLGTVIGYLYAVQSTPLYRATSSILLADPRTQTTLLESRQSSTDPGRYVRNQARVVTSQPVLDLAAQGLGVPSSALGVEAEAQLDVDSITITAVDVDPQRAAVVADAVAAAYEQYRTEQTAAAAGEAIAALTRARQELEGQLVVIEEQLADDPSSPTLLAEREAATQQLQVLLTRERQLSVDTALFGGGVELIEAATPPTAPFEPRPLRSAAAGALLSLAYSSAGAWWWNRRRPSALATGRMDRLLKAPLLGDIPVFSRSLGPFPAATSPLSPEAEAYRFLLAAVTRAMRTHGARSLLITSAGPGEGKTSTAINLAVVGAGTGHRLVLVDADVRVRGLTTATRVDPDVALQDVVRDGVPVRLALGRPAVEGLEGLSIACPEQDDTSEDPAVFLRSPGFGEAVARLAQVAETVVVDSPPVLAVADTFEMVPRVDAVLLVVSPWTSEDTLTEVRRRLDLAGATVLGYVLNRTEGRKETYAYGAGPRAKRTGRAAAGTPAAPAPADPAVPEPAHVAAEPSSAAAADVPVPAAAAPSGSAPPSNAVDAPAPSVARHDDQEVRQGSSPASTVTRAEPAELSTSHDVGWPRHAAGG